MTPGGYRALPGVVVLLLLSVFSDGLLVQSPPTLRARRTQLLKQLERTDRELATTRNRKGAAIDRANLLGEQVAQRRALIETLEAEIDRSRRRMQRDSNVILSLSDDLDEMRREYGEVLRVTNRARLNRGWLIFLLSAEGLNDALRRVAYLRQYRRFRLRQGNSIRRTRRMLGDRYEELALQRFTQDSLLEAYGTQDDILRRQLADQQSTVAKLTTTERQLLQRAREQRARSERLNEAVTSAIARSERRQRQQQRQRQGGGVSSIVQRRGRLGWPVVGRVVRGFGRQPHPDVPSVKISSSGLDIQAAAGKAVEAVYTGEVIAVRELGGLRTTVMIRHGEYYTVYGNLSSVAVTQGQEVTAGQRVGQVPTDGSPIHFELWKGKTPQNPDRWLTTR